MEKDNQTQQAQDSKTWRMAVLYFKQVLTLKQKTKIMKKYLFMAVAGMLALSSCSNDSDELVINETPHEMTFTAGYGDATRAAISGTSVTWESGDRIKVFSTKNNPGKTFSLSTGAGTNSATFTGTAVDDSKFYVVYPNGGTSLDGTTIKGLRIERNQYNEDAWQSMDAEDTSGLDKWSTFAVAVADAGEALRFKSICAILKVKLIPGSWGCSNTTVKVQADEDMADMFDYNTEDGTITCDNNGVNYNFVQAQQVNVEGGSRTLYLKILPGTFTNFNLLVKGNHDTFANKTKASVTFEAGKVYDLGSYDVDE